jgi:hypothetical protein
MNYLNAGPISTTNADPRQPIRKSSFGVVTYVANRRLNVVRSGSAIGYTVRTVRDRLGRTADIRPVEITAQIFHTDPPICGSLNLDTLVRRDGSLPRAPLLHGWRLNADGARESRFAAYNFASAENGFLSGRVHES